MAIEGYGSGALTHHQAGTLLGLSRFEFDDFLIARQIHDHAYSLEDLCRDLKVLERIQTGLPCRDRACIPAPATRIVDRATLAHEDDGLGRGEWEAVEFAEETHASLLLIDEREGARIARQHGLSVTGTLGVFVEATRRNLVSIDAALGATLS